MKVKKVAFDSPEGRRIALEVRYREALQRFDIVEQVVRVLILIDASIT